MEKLEMFNSFKHRFGDQINPNVQSVKYCQNEEMASIEIQCSDQPDVNVDLKFMGGEIVKGTDGSDKDIMPLFNPEADIVDNASRLLELDDYSLIMCLELILRKEAVKNIVDAYKKSIE